MAQKKKSPSEKIGSFLADFQSVCDDLLQYGFKKIKQCGKKPISKKETTTWTGALKNYAQKSVKFLGETGESFYKNYEEIKYKKGKKRHKAKGEK